MTQDMSNSLRIHLRSTDHGGLSFRPDCPVCTCDRLSATRPDAHAGLSRKLILGTLSSALLALSGPVGVAQADTPAGDEEFGPAFEEQEIPDGQSVDEAGEYGESNDDSDLGGSVPEPETEPVAPAPVAQPAPQPPPAHAPAPAPAPLAEPTPVEPAPVAQPAPVQPVPTAPVEPVPPPAPVAQPELGATPVSPPIGAPIGAPAAIETLPDSVERERAQNPSPSTADETDRRSTTARAPRSAVAAQSTQTSVPVEVSAPPVRTTPVSPTAPAASSGRAHVVQPGETLWSIAEGMLPRGASSEQVARMVNRLWDLNRSAIGTGSPDLLLAGTELRLPRS